jgi:hypothetical protein
LIVLSSVACTGDDGKGSAGEGGGEGGSEGGSTESGGTAPSGTEAGASEATQADTSADEDVQDCEDANEGAACSTPGEVCSNGDDCGSWTYECQSGTWVQIDGSGCGAEPIPCSASPVEGDGCGEAWYEECDLDGDCRDVLQCRAYEWELREVCCAELAPEQGQACDEPFRSCITEHACGTRMYECQDDAWNFQSGSNCDTPQPCSAAPVPGDACDTHGDVCPGPRGGITLVCEIGIWVTQ